jgi:tRNA A-37 threonylcarbamoyl transferase component Bud32
MAEKLIEIQADYGDFSSTLILPYEYFLFDKLHKMALEDPDLIESYGCIYSGGQRKGNLEFALRGFRDAAGSLASQGIITNTDGSIRILKGRKQRKNALRMLYEIHPRTTGGVVKNGLHSFASMAGVEYKSKPLPKLTIKEKVQSTIELDRPNKLLRLDEGVIFDDPSKSIEEIALISGFSGTYAHEEEKKGGLINSSTQLKVSSDGREAKFILKHFPELKNAKWVLLNLWAFAAKRFNMTPLSRLSREVEAVKRLHQIGIKTHVITGVVLDERTLVSEYAEGVPLDESVKDIASGKSTDTSSIERYAQVMAKMHKAGLVYGDTKPANALVGKDGIYLIDLEQAVDGGDRSWDLAEFLYYSAKIAKQGDGMKLVAESFLAAYRDEGNGPVVAKARSIRYMAPFLPFLTPKKIKVVRKALAKYS